MPVLLSATVSDASLDRLSQPLCTYSVSLLAQNGFVINTRRAYTGNNNRTAATAAAREEIAVHVLHHPFVDDFAKSGILNRTHDDVDPLLLLSKKSFKIQRPDGTSCRAYNVVVGSAYIVGVNDLSGRRILAPERITKVRSDAHFVFLTRNLALFCRFDYRFYYIPLMFCRCSEFKNK